MPDVQTDPSRLFLGVGWSFPLKVGADGTFELAQYEQDVRQSILIILQTNPGERVMRPDFGAGLNAFLFEPINTTTMAQLQRRVEEALIDFEPRINVQDVSVKPDENNRSTLLIEVEYLVRSTNNLHNLVFPFFLNEGAVA